MKLVSAFCVSLIDAVVSGLTGKLPPLRQDPETMGAHLAGCVAGIALTIAVYLAGVIVPIVAYARGCPEIGAPVLLALVLWLLVIRPWEPKL